jgi:hypothetical protein
MPSDDSYKSIQISNICCPVPDRFYSLPKAFHRGGVPIF